jgi:hypothetical protein
MMSGLNAYMLLLFALPCRCTIWQKHMFCVVLGLSGTLASNPLAILEPLKERLGVIDSMLASLTVNFSTHYSRLVIHYSLFVIHDPLFIFIFHYSSVSSLSESTLPCVCRVIALLATMECIPDEVDSRALGDPSSDR